MTATESSSGRFNPVRVLVPGTGTRFRCGGLSVALQTARLLSTLRPTQVVTYRERSDRHPFLDDLLRSESTPGEALWIVSWGFDVPRSLERLRGRPVVYQAHSRAMALTSARGAGGCGQSKHPGLLGGSCTPQSLVSGAQCP